MKYILQEYNGTMWLLDPIEFDSFDELQDYMINATKDLGPGFTEEYFASSVITEVSE